MDKTKGKIKKKSAPAKVVDEIITEVQTALNRGKEIEEQIYEKKSTGKKHNNWENVLDSSLNGERKNPINHFANLANNSIYGVMNTNNDYTTQTRNMLSKISTGISNNIEKNMELSRDFLKCQTAVDMIALQQKFFDMNFSNMINLYSDIGHCCRSMATSCGENVAACAEKSVKSLAH